MALFERPSLQRAKALFSLIVDGVLGPTEPEAPHAAPAPERRIRTEPARVPSALLRDPSFTGVGACHEPEGLLLSWRTSTEQHEDAARQLGAHAVRTLRVILMREERGDVAVDTLDLGEVTAEGARLLPTVPSLLSAVVSVGLKDDARFVSMAHTTVA